MNIFATIARNQFSRSILGVTLGLVLVLQTVAPTVTYATQSNENEGNQQIQVQNEDKVKICHRTDSDSNPYNEIEISLSALDTHLNNEQGHPAKFNNDGSPRNDIYPVPTWGCDLDNVDLEIKKSVNHEDIAINHGGIYTLSVKNDSNKLAHNVSVLDNLPSEVTYVSSTPSVGTYDSNTGIWFIGDLAAGSTVTLTINFTVNNTAEVDEDVKNVATVTSQNGESERDLRDNKDDAKFEAKKAKINPLVLTSICSSDPATIKNWQVTNPNAVSVNFSWKLLPSGSSTNSSVPANSSVTFLTNAQGTNDVQITWKNENNQNKTTHLVSTTTLCPKDTKPCGEELIENGSFETPAINQSWNIVNNNTPGLGWFVQWMPVVPGGAPTPASVELHRGVNGWLSQDGQQHAELDGDWGGPSSNQSGEDGSSKVYQYLPTEAGHTYNISFWTSPRPGVADNKIQFSWDGNVEATVTENGTGKTQTEWTQHTYSFTATGSMTTIEFADLSVGDSLGSFLDNVSVIESCVADVNLTGTKFNDKNSNGVRDPGEEGLAGWTIYAYDGVNGLASNITVDSTDTDGSDTNWVAPGEYIIMARGTWNNRIGSGDQELFDAEYYTQNGWGSHTDGTTPGDYPGAGANEGDLMLNNTFPSWGPYNDLDTTDFEHYYYMPYTHAGGNINFSIFDGDVNTGVKNPAWYTDNSGTINVQMYRVLATTVTDSNGNYVMNFNTVPGSTVTVGEFQQNGWVQTFPTAPGTHTFVAENGDNEISDKDFGNHQDNSCDPVREQDQLSKDVEDYNPCISTISGTKYHDLNGDGVRNEGEPGLEGWEMYAYNGIPSSNITVNSANKDGSNTNDVAEGDYVIMARGTWHNGGGSHYFDSEFHTTDSWTTHEDGEVGTGPDNGDLLVNDAFVNWSVYNDQNENGFEHYYFLIYHHPGGNINYSVFDGTGGVKNPGWYGDNDGSLNVQMYPLLDTAVTDSNGDYTLDINTTDPVTVVVREIQQNGWVQTSPNASTDVYALNGLIEGANYPITGNWNMIFETGIRNVTGKDFGNRHQGINVKADKIVCDAEEYLPNWGAGSNGNPGLITADTAQNFVNASNGHCNFQAGWSFQWGHNDKDNGDDGTTEGVDMTKGDHIGPADSDGDSTGLCGAPYCGVNTLTGEEYDEWQGFDTTTSSNVIMPSIVDDSEEIPAPGYMPAMLTIDDLNGSDRIWVREELQKGFVPFSAPEDEFPGSDVSAEIYCHDDIANYDNFDYILNPTAGNTYYCVAFNAPEPKNNDIVTGQKWHDYNGNGEMDNEEEGIKDWTIYAAKEITSTVVNAQDSPVTPLDQSLFENNAKYLLHVDGTFTAGDGIEADARFSERNSSGTWTDLVQSYESYGPELLDLQLSNDNGSSYDSFLTDPYDSGHSYWHEFTYTSGQDMLFKINDIFPSNNAGSLNVTLYKVIASTQTDENGNYSFDLSEEDGQVIIMEEHQFNWEQTFPQANGDDKDFYTIDASGVIQNGENLDFGNRLLCRPRYIDVKVALDDEYGEQNPGCNTISGYKWNDLDGDGNWDQGDSEEDISDEPALGGVRIYLDLNNNNSFDEGEPYDITDENGYYAFYNLPTGSYTVREVVPSGYYQTYPYNEGDDEYVITVNNTNSYNNDFGNKQSCFEVEVDEQIPTFRDVLNTSENCISYVDPAVVKTVDNSSPAHGATIVYTITVTNNSVDTTATGIEITDAIPSGVTYVSDDGSGAYNSGTHIWTIPSLGVGASVTLHITATVDGNASGTITNTATVTDSDLGDTDYSNNTDSADITVQTSGGGGSVTTQGGGGGCVGDSCFGGRTPGNPGSGDGGEVLGDFTDTPSISAPQVLGATTSLPRTGSTLGQLFAVLGLSVLPLLFGKKKQTA